MNFLVKNKEKLLIIDNKFLSLNDNLINLSFDGDNRFYIVDFSTHDFDLKIKMQNIHKSNFKVCFYAFNDANHKKISIDIYQDNASNSECNLYLFATNQSNTEISINNYAKTKQFGIRSSQNIYGNIFDESSSIKVIPAVYTSTSKINSNHGVKIGQVDKEKLFFLNTRGFTQMQALRTLLESQIFEIKQESNNQLKLICKHLIEKIETFARSK